MNYYEVTKEIDIKEYLKSIEEKCLLVYSPTSIDKNKININKSNLKIYSTSELTIEKETIDRIITNLDEYKRVISIGGGTATDIGKYISNKFNKELICIPTMLSTNAYSTNKVAIVVDGKKETLDAKLPDKIFIDQNILKNSNENNLYGVADIFSISTASNDWLLANKYNNEEITIEYDEANKLLNETIDYVLNNDSQAIKENQMLMYKLVGDAGEITNKFGCGRPESGSEHIFAKGLEKEIKIPHAIAVANGIVLMLYAQSLILDKKLDDKPYIALKKLGIYELNKKYNISSDLITKVFMNLKPREDRYSVVNLIYKDNELKEKIIYNYKNIMTELGY